jgi:hypothetical protein
MQGCLLTLAAILAFFILLLAGGWFLYRSAIERFTSPRSVPITLEPISDSQYQTAADKLERFHSGLGSGEKQVIEFTASDLNALIARHPVFANPRRQIRVKMADAIITLDFNAPLENAGLPGLKERWINGTAIFSFDYSYEQFRITPKSVVLNGNALPQIFLSENVISSFNRSFTKNFMNALARNRQSDARWKNIESIGVRGDKLVVVTRSTETANSVSQPNEQLRSRRIACVFVRHLNRKANRQEGATQWLLVDGLSPSRTTIPTSHRD